MVRGSTLANGLELRQVRVPLGVVGIIYEARPNVTADAAGLCLKSGNAVLLRGSVERLPLQRRARRRAARRAAARPGCRPTRSSWCPGTATTSVKELMRARGLVDVLIPRGGAGLIRSVVEESTVPVIETGVGNCHVYVDATPTSTWPWRSSSTPRPSGPSVCNAAETLLVHADVADAFLPRGRRRRCRTPA